MILRIILQEHVEAFYKAHIAFARAVKDAPVQVLI
jgi:hypothetical protein